MRSERGARSMDEMLSKREQQVMELLHRSGPLSARHLFEAIPDLPSYDATRSVLRGLEESGRLQHHREGRRFVYEPTQSPDQAAREALHRLLRTFFDGCREDLVHCLFDRERVTGEELDSLQALIDASRAREVNDR